MPLRLPLIFRRVLHSIRGVFLTLLQLQASQHRSRMPTRLWATSYMDIALIFVLILVNGLFAMSEIAVVSSRKSRLQNLADDGSLGAQAALSLHQEPSSFFSTIQVGITSVGILSGAIGEAAVADPLAAWFAGIPLLEPYAKTLALTITVVGLTYFSVVVGELVPKRLAMLAPEGIASLIARPMIVLARITHPLVVILSSSCTAILRLLGARAKEEQSVTNDEINVLMEQGAEAGVFHESEQELVSNVLRLDEQRIAAIMTPRREMFVVDLDEDEETVQQRIIDAGRASARGEGPCQPLNPVWDAKVLDLLSKGDMAAFDRMKDDEVRRDGGSGGPEIRAWQAAFAALATAGNYSSTVEYYRAIPEWIVGMGVMHAASKDK